MAATQVPFVIALAGKNNLISYLTGLSYEKVRPCIGSTSRLFSGVY